MKYNGIVSIIYTNIYFGVDTCFNIKNAFEGKFNFSLNSSIRTGGC